MSMTVEFLGIPASGKSTLAAQVAEDLREADVVALSLDDGMIRAVGTGVGDKLMDPLMSIMPRRIRERLAESVFIRSPAFYKSLVQFALANPRALSVFLEGQARRAEFEAGPEMVINWFLQLVARYQFVHQQLGANEVLLLDEGFCQRVLTGFGVGFSRDDHRDVESYLGSIPPPDLLVYLIPDIEVVSRRLVWASQGRDPSGRVSIYGTKRLDGSGIDPREFLDDCARTVDFVVNAADQVGWPTLGLDSSDSLQIASEKAVEHVARIAGQER